MDPLEETKYEEIEEEEEIEVTDDEQEMPLGEPLRPSTPSATPTRAPGKVQPTERVKNMEMRSPATPATPGTSLSPTKNPFTTYGSWTASDMSQIEIVFPVLSSKDETTNDLTRSSRPDCRYWRAPIKFKYSSFSSDTIRFENVHIPFHTGRDYGSSFVYLCLPGFAADMFAEAGKTRRPTRVVERSLLPDKNRWWKVANKVDKCFGVINNSTKRFQVKNLATVFDGSQAGISATVVVKFWCRASTDDKSPLKPTTPCYVAAEVVRGFITDVDVDVQMPSRADREKRSTEPVATRRDVATDSVMDRLAALGL